MDLSSAIYQPDLCATDALALATDYRISDGSIPMMDPALRDLMADTITLAPYQANGVDGYGEPIWGAPVAYKARVQIGAVRWFNAEMREITAGGRVIFDLPPGGRMPDIKDKLALPADFGPAAPKILDVVAQRDEIGRHHVTLIVG